MSGGVAVMACDHVSLGATMRDLARDIERYPRGRRGFLSTLGLLTTPQVLVTLLYRVSHWLFARQHRGLAQAVAWLNVYVHKASFSPSSCIGGGLYLASPVGLVFDGRAGGGLSLYTASVCSSGGPTLLGLGERAPLLGDEVSLGTHAVVLPPAVVGDGVQVGFKVVLQSRVAPRRVVVSRAMLSRQKPHPRNPDVPDEAPG